MIKNEAVDKMKLNIQLFADTADNDSDDNASVNTDNAGSDELDFVDGTPAIADNNAEDNDKKISTKAFSDRLKREKLKIEQDAEKNRIAELDRIAIGKGYKNWNDMDSSATKEKLERIGIDDVDTFTSIINDAVSKNPIVLEAKKVIQSQKEKEQQNSLNSAISEINKMDSDIKSINDLISLDNYDEFYALVEQGYSLPNAYKVFAFDKLASKKAATAAQNVITNIDSKSHLKTIKGAQTKDIVIPDEVLTMYKKNMPKMTESEIRKHYEAYIGGNE